MHAEYGGVVPGAGVPGSRPPAPAADPDGARPKPARSPSRSTASPTPPGPDWSVRCSSAARSPAASPSPGDVRRSASITSKGTCSRRCSKRRRPSFRSWRCSSRAATRCWPWSAASGDYQIIGVVARRRSRRGVRQDGEAARTCRIRAAGAGRSSPTAAGPGKFQFPRPMLDRPGLDFSFSGLKTAVVVATRDVQLDEQTRADVALRVPAGRRRNARREVRARSCADRHVDAGRRGRRRRERVAAQRARGARASARGVKVLYPRPEFCTDNAAMIAYAGYRRLAGGEHDELKIRATARWPLDTLRPPPHSLLRPHSEWTRSFSARSPSNASSASGSGSAGSSRPSSSIWRWPTDIRRAAASDRIEDTIDYKKVAKRLLAFVGESQFHLVETLAEQHRAASSSTEFGVQLGEGAAQQAGRDPRRARRRHRDRAARGGLSG